MSVAINIDSNQEQAFPISRKSEMTELERRAKALASLLQRINNLCGELAKGVEQN
jgi:hypothetical protein